jgi:HEAT repeat protein
VPALTAALSDRSADVRVRAAWALGTIEPRQAPAALTAALRADDEDVREAAAWALGRIEDAGASAALDAALTAEKSERVQKALLWALLRVGGTDAATIRRLLDSPSAEVRRHAVAAVAGRTMGPNPWPWPWPQPRPFP